MFWNAAQNLANYCQVYFFHTLSLQQSKHGRYQIGLPNFSTQGLREPASLFRTLTKHDWLTKATLVHTKSNTIWIKATIILQSKPFQRQRSHTDTVLRVVRPSRPLYQPALDQEIAHGIPDILIYEYLSFSWAPCLINQWTVHRSLYWSNEPARLGQ